MKKYRLLIFILLLPCCSPQKDWIIQESGFTDGIHDIEMIDNETGFAYTYGTGKLLKTSDGGQSWDLIAQFDSLYFEQIQFTDEHNGYICGEKNTLLKTSDGGQTWENKGIGQEHDDIMIYGMCFTNNQNGYAAALRTENGKFISRIYQTIDGGQTWKLINNIPHMILNIEEIGNEIWGSGNGVIIRNIDRQDQWIYSFTDSSRSTGQIRDLAADQKGTIIAVSFTGKVLIKQTDNEEWEIQDITHNRLRSIARSGKNKWLIAGDKNIDKDCAIFQSMDNGKNWLKVKNEFPDIHRICVTRKHIWIAGKEGFIARK
jgi:photosystem II stability/assembly factor-like uncharacterized protein